MSEVQLQTINDIIKMTPRLNMDCLKNIKVLMEKEIDMELLKLEPSIILDNMDITEKVMYLDHLLEENQNGEKQLEDAISFEEILEKEGLTVENLQNKN